MVWYVRSASSRARRTTGTMPRRCSREASSGTTPPYGWCVVNCEKTTLEAVCSPERTTAAAVSSQELSMPRMYTSGMATINVSGFGMNTAAVEIVRTLRQRSHQAYLVGGCVRDLLLGREPADYDVATDATPTEVMKIFPETYAVGAQFGVVLVPADSLCKPVGDWGEASPATSHCIEVATFRCDGLYSDSRHPDEVRYTRDPKEDVQRRDFTINGLLLDPLENNQVLDFVGGRADLEAGVIRTIGEPEKRFAEDKLRMLRAVRFAARFGYAIEKKTLRAIQKLAAQISLVSRERVRDEIVKMLTEGAARRAFELLDEA